MKDTSQKLLMYLGVSPIFISFAALGLVAVSVVAKGDCGVSNGEGWQAYLPRINTGCNFDQLFQWLPEASVFQLVLYLVVWLLVFIPCCAWLKSALSSGN